MNWKHTRYCLSFPATTAAGRAVGTVIVERKHVDALSCFDISNRGHKKPSKPSLLAMIFTFREQNTLRGLLRGKLENLRRFGVPEQYHSIRNDCEQIYTWSGLDVIGLAAKLLKGIRP